MIWNYDHFQFKCKILQNLNIYKKRVFNKDLQKNVMYWGSYK
jgi:hypothetical protein